MFRDEVFGISNHCYSPSHFRCNCFYMVFPFKLIIDVTPRYFTKGFCSIGSPDITRFALKGSVVILSFIVCLVPMSIDFVWLHLKITYYCVAIPHR